MAGRARLCGRQPQSRGHGYLPAFCAWQTVREVALTPESRCQTCPFGHTEVVVPVIVQGRAVGPGGSDRGFLPGRA